MLPPLYSGAPQSRLSRLATQLGIPPMALHPSAETPPLELPLVTIIVPRLMSSQDADTTVSLSLLLSLLRGGAAASTRATASDNAVWKIMHAQGWQQTMVALLSSNSPAVQAHALCLCGAAGLAAAAGSPSAEALCSALFESSAAPRVIACLKIPHEAVLMHACAAIRSLSSVANAWRDVLRKHGAVTRLQALQNHRNSLVARFCMAAIGALCHSDTAGSVRAIGPGGEDRLGLLETKLGATPAADASPEERLQWVEEQLAAALASGKLPPAAVAVAPDAPAEEAAAAEPPPLQEAAVSRLLAVRPARCELVIS
jgi:hypothetical protein